MSVDFVALFLGKALADSLKRKMRTDSSLFLPVQETSASQVGFVTAKI